MQRGDSGGDVVPISRAEVPAAEGEPLVFVGVDEGSGLLVVPARRRDSPGRGGRDGDGGGRIDGHGDGRSIGG